MRPLYTPNSSPVRARCIVQYLPCHYGTSSTDRALLCIVVDRYRSISPHGPLTRYVKFRIVHASGMPGTCHRFQRKPLVSDPGMHHDTCVTHVPWRMSGLLTRGSGENAPGIPGACTTRNLTYLSRGPLNACDGIVTYMVRKRHGHDNLSGSRGQSFDSPGTIDAIKKIWAKNIGN